MSSSEPAFCRPGVLQLAIERPFSARSVLLACKIDGSMEMHDKGLVVVTMVDEDQREISIWIQFAKSREIHLGDRRKRQADTADVEDA